MDSATEKTKGRTEKKISVWVYFGLVAAMIVCGIFVWLNRGVLGLHSSYPIESTSEMSFGADGKTLVIDNGKKTLLVLDAQGDLVEYFQGGSDNTPFYYAVYVAQTDDGSIYLVEIRYGERGNLLDRERILRLKNGNWEELYAVDYTEWDIQDTPLQYGRIVELQAYGDSVYYLLDAGEMLELHQIGPDGEITDLAAIPSEGVKNDASYDPVTQQVVVIWRSGGMLLYDLKDGSSRSIETRDDMMPYDIAVRGGMAYYTELLGCTVRCFSLENPEEDTVFCTLEALPFKLDANTQGEILATDQVGFYRISGTDDQEDAVRDYVDEAKTAFFSRIVMTWILLGLGGLCALALLIRVFVAIITAAMHSENALRVVLIVAASFAVSFVLAYTLLARLLTTNTGASEKQVALYSELLLAEIDEDTMRSLDSPSDYGSDAFLAMKEKLDKHTWATYESGDYNYYCLYRAINGNIVMVMDFEDTMPCTRPQYIYDPEDEEDIYSAALARGERVQTTELSAYGNWSFILAPIYGSDGSIIGELDAGQNLDLITRRQSELTRELIVSTVISTIVVAMLLLELNFLLTHIQRRRSEVDLDNTQRVPLRTMIFLIYLADAMQDVFIAILSRQLYQGGLPIPDGVAIALPLSAQLLMMAIFSLFAGRLVERFGSRLCMTTGMLINLAGFLTCMLMGSYSGLVIGKMLIGMGMGTVYVSCNAVAATGANSTLIANANAAISAGTLAGVTIGAGLASVLLSMGGWRLIYLVGAVIIAFGLVLAATSMDVRMGREKGDLSLDRHIGTGKFFSSRRVTGFFLLILLPFMMSLSYREYFFPLFSAEHGLNEVRIGQIYLLCGVLSLYTGPSLSSWMIKKLGAYWSIIVASCAMGINMLIFVIFPSLWAVIFGVVLLSLINSFALTSQYTYFELTPETMLYGEGRAVGIYSVFESLGQTVGPIAYGALLSFGYQSGIGFFCAAVLILALVFLLLMRRLGKLYK